MNKIIPIFSHPDKKSNNRSPMAAFVLNTLAGPLPMIGGMAASFGMFPLPSLLKGETVNGLAMVSPLLLGLCFGVSVSAAAVHVLSKSGPTTIVPPVQKLRARRQGNHKSRGKNHHSL